MPNYNRGQKYERRVLDKLSYLGLLPDNLYGNDAGFIHWGKEYFLEVKNATAPDFGQKGLVWDQSNGWTWRITDHITDYFDRINLIAFIDPEFIPQRYTKQPNMITIEDKHFDQENFEVPNIPINDVELLYEYYARNGCYYIQIENKGFYYLKEDIASLGVPKFMPKLSLRLRAKTHHSNPIYNYSFFAVIRLQSRSFKNSPFDIDEKVGCFPNIVP